MPSAAASAADLGATPKAMATAARIGTNISRSSGLKAEEKSVVEKGECAVVCVRRSLHYSRTPSPSKPNL
jgi:hypothetical protein